MNSEPMTTEIHVLHVDDDPAFREMVVELLEREDGHYHVDTVPSATAAIERIQRDEPDCIVSDYEMSEVDGIEFLHSVRETHPSLPFLLLTARGNEEIASEAIAAGATDYLPKRLVAGQAKLLANRIRNAVDQYRSQQQLRQNERRFEAIFQDPNMLIGLLEPDGKIRKINDTALQAIEAGHQDVVGEPFWSTDWWTADTTNNLKEWISRGADGEYVEYEADHPTSGGDLLSVEGTIRPVTNDDGNVISLVASARNITERRQRTEELEMIHERMEFALESADAVIWEQNHETGEIVTYPKTCAVLGGPIHSRDEFIDRVHEEDRTTITEATQSVFETGEPKTVEFRTVPRLDVTWIKTQIQPVFNEDDAVLWVVGLSRDITDQKEREQTLKEQAEHFDQLLHSIASDLETCSQTLQDRQEPANETDETTQIDDARTVADFLNELQERLTTIVQIPSGGDEGIHLDIADLASDAWANPNFTNSSKLEIRGSPQIVGDPDATQQLLEHLLMNSIDHTDGDTTVHIGAVTNGFYIEDNGPGVDPEVREKIFKPGATTKPDCAGLGMTIVRQIADHHGWELKISAAEQLTGTRIEVLESNQLTTIDGES